MPLPDSRSSRPASRAAPKRSLNGWVNLDKPYGMTSTAAVGAVKWLLRPQKIGHAGTLDPLATGILPLALGEATKTVPYLVEARKTYRFTLKFGEETSTGDTEGEVVARSDVRPEREAILACLPRFTGEIMQTPPAFSAIKVNGERAYDLARAGVAVELTPRRAVIHKLALLEYTEDTYAQFETTCGKGTYIRSLARDIALFLNTKGHVSALRRQAVGGFDETNMISLEKLEAIVHTAEPFADGAEGMPSLMLALKEAILPVAAGLDDIPAIRIGKEGAHQLRHGQGTLVPRSDFPAGEGQAEIYGGLYAAYCFGELVAMVERNGNMVAPVRVFAPAPPT